MLVPQLDLIELEMHTKMAHCHRKHLKYMTQAFVLDINSEENAIKVCNPIMYQKKYWVGLSSLVTWKAQNLSKRIVFGKLILTRENINILKCVLLAA